MNSNARESYFILMPARGYRDDSTVLGSLHANANMTVRRPGTQAEAAVRIVDTIGQNGPVLAAMSPDALAAMRQRFGATLRIVPLVEYERPRPEVGLRAESNQAVLAAQAMVAGLRVSVRDKRSGAPVTNARVVAFTLFAHREGDAGLTNADGSVHLRIQSTAKIERLYVYPANSYWSALAMSPVSANGGFDVELEPIDPAMQGLALERFRGDLPTDAGKGVKIAIIDSGVTRDHPNLPGVGGRNCVRREIEALENPDEWDDFGGHGTHVAGIAGARPSARWAFRGIAPGASIRSYRVFPQDPNGRASNFDIMRAIDFAVADNCDVINLSLGGGAADEGIRGAIGDAKSAGVLVVAAAGNGERKPISYPAAFDHVVAVTAIGTKSGFPTGTAEHGDIAKPISPIDPDIFLARFTNVGTQAKVTAPGVGIVSAAPGGGVVAMSGTSMAAPMVAGLAAAVLQLTPGLMDLEREKRLEPWLAALYGCCVPLGMDPDHEGIGLPLPKGPWRDRLLAATLTS